MASPASWQAQLHQAHTLLGQGNAAAAELLYRQLLNAGLENATLLGNLGVICWQSGRYGEMEQLLRRALQLEPANADAHYNLALVLAQRGAAAEAISHYRQALPLASSRLQGSIHWNLSKLLLRQGHYAAGWQHYEWRRHKAQPLPPICQPGMPAWDGRSPLDGELVLVGEQGLGDMLQFLRYAPAMAAFAPQVALGLPEKLHGLVRSSKLPVKLLSPAHVSAQRNGHWLPLLSVPGLLGVCPEAVQVEAPYLQVPPERLQHWRQRLRAELAPGERLVGLHWQGNPATETSELRGRSLPLQALDPLAEIAGVRFVSLQKGPGSEQLAGSAIASRLVACQGAVDACWDFVDTGAMLLACDLLISSDSALVHLAGALGAPTWLLLHHGSDWRWGEAGDTSFWYPSLRLFRQQQPGDWAGVIATLQRDLRRWPGQRSAQP
ncbi:MAG: tetratricopeptide repeat protein [Prochlorococcaceae cyanobacterium]